MPVTVQSPLGAAASTAAAFFSAQQDSKKARAEAERQARIDAQNAALQSQQMKLATDAADLNKSKFDYQKGEDVKADALAQAAAVTAAKKQAADQVHLAREDALKAAQEKYTETKDDRAYHVEIMKITQTHNDAMAKIKADRDVASVRASAELGAASIHASAELGAAQLREAGDESRQSRTEQFQTEQQARLFKHQDALNKQKAAISPKTDAANAAEVKGLVGDDWKALPPATQGLVRGLVTKHGMADTIQALTQISNGAPNKAGITKEQADAALSALQGDQ